MLLYQGQRRWKRPIKSGCGSAPLYPVFCVRSPSRQVANNEWMGRMASGVLARGHVGLLVVVFFIYLASSVWPLLVLLYSRFCVHFTFYFLFVLSLSKLCLSHTPRSLHCFTYASHYPRQRGLYYSHIASHTESDLRRCANFSFRSRSYLYHSSFLPLWRLHIVFAILSVVSICAVAIYRSNRSAYVLTTNVLRDSTRLV